MKIENLEKACSLKERLRIINVNIETVEKSVYIKFYGGNSFEVSSKEIKYYSAFLLERSKKIILNSLIKEKEDILKEIKKIN